MARADAAASAADAATADVAEAGLVEAAVVEAGVVEAGVVEPDVVEPGLVEADVVEPGVVEVGVAGGVGVVGGVARVASAALCAAWIASPATVAAAAAAAFIASPGSAPAIGSDEPWARLWNEEGGGIHPELVGAVRRIDEGVSGVHAPAGMEAALIVSHHVGSGVVPEPDAPSSAGTFVSVGMTRLSHRTRSDGGFPGTDRAPGARLGR
ncbi:hypothetical protein [Labedella endophytica]|uniref:Uncharacterized protein n=1 Tax=Labedella endophytica TaxID=1523160 RepID=A0A3S0XDG7_9MICO|nr:hypothetical protein [Labedella endophytica]RUR03354.1 hypothetical protein ELQ94_02050 [Labedella endophytica]